MTTNFKWTEENTAKLLELVGSSGVVSREVVELAAEELGTSVRSVGSKLRRLEREVEPVAKKASKFSEKQTQDLQNLLESNPGKYTYHDLAEILPFTPKEIQGKVLSLRLSALVKKQEKVETPKTYSDSEETLVVSMIKAGHYIEEIAEKLAREVNSIRGKALSLLRAGVVDKLPVLKTKKEQPVDGFIELLEDIPTLTVAQIAEKLTKTERGVKTMLTRRGIKCVDYDGEKRHEKAVAKAEASVSLA
jgi:predicted transcriptional regulator